MKYATVCHVMNVVIYQKLSLFSTIHWKVNPQMCYNRISVKNTWNCEENDIFYKKSRYKQKQSSWQRDKNSEGTPKQFFKTSTSFILRMHCSFYKNWPSKQYLLTNSSIFTLIVNQLDSWLLWLVIDSKYSSTIA